MPSRSRKKGKTPAMLEGALADAQGRPGARAKSESAKVPATPKVASVKSEPSKYAVLYCDECGSVSFDTPACTYCGPKSRAAVTPLGPENHPPAVLQDCYDVLDKCARRGSGAKGWCGSAPFLAWDRVAATPSHYTLYFYPHKTQDKSAANAHEWYLIDSEEEPGKAWDVYHIEKKPPSAKGAKAEPIEWYVDTIEHEDDLLEVLEEYVNELTPAQLEATEAKAKAAKERAAKAQETKKANKTKPAA